VDSKAINVVGVSKYFKLPHEKTSTIKGALIHNLARKRTFEEQHVLENITFDINKGDFFGIIGRNGSGKSTLLKLLAGIYAPDSGSIHINGKLTPFIELGVGFNPELTGRENVYLNGALLGFNRLDMEAMYDDIVAFAELERFMDQKIKNYSSGMQVRLAFSIAIRSKSDILLFDEVLAVGDANFQLKCLDVFRELKAAKKTVILVSHNAQVIAEFTDKCLLLDHARSYGVHDTSKALEMYTALNVGAGEKTQSKKENKVDKDKPHIAEVSINNLNSKEVCKVKRGDDLKVKVKLKNPQKIPIASGISVVRNDGTYCFGTNSRLEKIKLAPESEISYSLYFPKIPLNAGKYYIVCGVFDENVLNVYEIQEKAATIRVYQDDDIEGLLCMPHKWEG
jgi:ABC-2 type transport system ATP-binding protein